MSISSNAEFCQAIEQAGRIEQGLLSLHRDLPSATSRNLALLVEGPLDQLAELQADIQEYLLRACGEDFVEMRLIGPRIRLRDTPTSVLTNMLDAVRKGIQAIAELRLKGQRAARPTAELKRICDFRVLALAPGSLRILMRLPDEEQGSLSTGETNPAATALDDYLSAASWASSDESASDLDARLWDPKLRKAVLTELERIVPRPRGELEAVEFSGPRVEMKGGTKRLRLNRETRVRVNSAIDRMVHEVQETYVGVLREIDLDHQTFILRRSGESVERPCTFEEELHDAAKEALDKTVRVTGSTRIDPSKRVQALLTVTRLEILEEADADPGVPGG